MTASIAKTARLRLRRFTADDSAFIVELLNDPAWIRYIGDKHIGTLDDATRYLENGPIAMYERAGFGLYAVELRQNGETIGMCGLIKRDALDDVDLGFAFLPQFRGNGYALEAASAAVSFGTRSLGLRRIVAIVSRDNDRSIRLLAKLGFRFESTVRLLQDEQELLLYALGAPAT
jgi:ribosomal-protein-alanine N-acetyltransferase